MILFIEQGVFCSLSIQDFDDGRETASVPPIVVPDDDKDIDVS